MKDRLVVIDIIRKIKARVRPTFGPTGEGRISDGDFEALVTLAAAASFVQRSDAARERSAAPLILNPEEFLKP